MPIHLVGERKKEKERVREIQWESEKPTDIVCETDREREPYKIQDENCILLKRNLVYTKQPTNFEITLCIPI